MKEFTIAFPLSVAREDASAFIEKALRIRIPEERKPVIVPGSSVFFTPIVQGPAEGLVAVFSEHAPLDASESAALAAHRSLFFLQFVLKSDAEFVSFLDVAKRILDSGALGVYVENSGCAFCARLFLELISGDVPLEAFINFIQTPDSLFTLGLEPFGFPDLCISTRNPAIDARAILVSAADSIVTDAVDYASGAKWSGDDGQSFEFRQEAKAPYAKNSPEWNATGYRRLVAR